MTSKSIEEETNGRDRAKALTERVFRRVDEMSRMLDQKALEKKREAVLRGDLLVGGVPSAALSRTPSRVDKGESGSRRHRRFDRKTLLSATTAQARAINGNNDWYCKSCRTLNFARTVVCIKCSDTVHEDTEYILQSDKQKRRYEAMMRLANARK